MKITDVTTSHINYITIDGEEYIRFNAEAWYIMCAASYEPVWSYDVEPLELAYQEYVRTSGARNE